MKERDIFIEALEKRSLEERKQYIEKACGDDLPARRRLERLLQAHEESDSLLEHPVLDSPEVAQWTIERPPSRIGPYKLREQIGAGGFGVVYVAEQTEPVRREVALKIIKPGMDTHQVILRFEAERQALALMDHPNIAKVFDAGKTEVGRPYFVMELVHGIPMTEYCDNCGLTTRERLQLFVAVCNAIQHAHQKGIIHRDIKPSNVMIAVQDGRPIPKIIDFGVAKAINQRLTKQTLRTAFAEMVGTPLYMSPEQAEMSPLDVDTRTDIYSLGVLLYELLTGSTPLENSRLADVGYDELRRIIREEEPPRPSSRLSSTLAERGSTVARDRRTEPRKLIQLVHGDLDWIVMKAMEKDRSRRYESANALARDVERYLENEPVEARPPSATYQFGKFARRHKTAFIATIFVAVSVVIAALVSSAMAIRATRAERRAQAEAEKANHLLYVSNMHQASLAWWDGNTGRVLELLERHRPDKGDPDLRGFEWYHLWRECQHGLTTPTIQFDGGVYSLAISADGRTLAVGGVDHQIRLLAIDSLKEIATIQGHTAQVLAIAFSPDSQILATGSFDHTVKLWDTETGTELAPLNRERAGLWAVAFSPDGKTLATANYDGTSTLWDVATRKRSSIVGDHSDQVREVAFGPDGTTLITSSLDGSFQLWDVLRADKMRVLMSNVRDPWTSALSSNGQTLAISDADLIRLLDVGLGRETSILRGHGGLVLGLAFSANGEHLASCGTDNTVRIWNPHTGHELQRLRGHTNSVHSLAFSPDGKHLFSGGHDNCLKIWDLASPQMQNVLPHPKGVPSVAFSTDGRWLASACEDGKVRIWDEVTGQKSFEIDGGAGPVRSVRLFTDREQSFIAAAIDGSVRFWNWNTRKEVQRQTAHAGPDLPLASSTEPLLFAWEQPHNTVLVWRYDRDEEIARFPGDYVRDLEFSPDANSLAMTRANNTIEVWSITSRKRLSTLGGHHGVVNCLAYSPDGSFLVSGGGDRKIRVWDLRGSHRKDEVPLHRTLAGHGTAVTCIAFSSQGTLATGGTDHTVRLWDLETGDELAVLKGHRGAVIGLAFSPDGSTLASGSRDRTVRLWRTGVSLPTTHVSPAKRPLEDEG